MYNICTIKNGGIKKKGSALHTNTMHKSEVQNLKNVRAYRF